MLKKIASALFNRAKENNSDNHSEEHNNNDVQQNNHQHTKMLTTFMKILSAGKNSSEALDLSEEEAMHQFQSYKLSEKNINEVMNSVHNHQDVNFVNFFGKLIPEDEAFYQYLSHILPRVTYPNKKDNKLHISLQALSLIWKYAPKKGAVLLRNKERTKEGISKAIAYSQEKIKKITMPQIMEQIKNTPVEELNETTPVKNTKNTQNMQKAKTNENPNNTEVVPEEVEGILSENIIEDTNDIQESTQEMQSEQNYKEQTGQEHSHEAYESYETHEQRTDIYSAKTPEELTEAFIDLTQTENIEDYFFTYVQHEDLRELYSEMSPLITGPVRTAVLYQMFLLDVLGDKVPSVLVKEKTEPVEFMKKIPGRTTTIADMLSKIPLFVHVVSQTKFAVKDLPVKMEAGKISRDDVSTVLCAVFLHDIGKFFVYQPDTKINMEHAEFGAQLLEEMFKLPKSFTRLIREHHVFAKSSQLVMEDDKADILLQLVRFYDRTERQMEIDILSPSKIALADAGSFTKEHAKYLSEKISAIAKKIDVEKQEVQVKQGVSKSVSGKTGSKTVQKKEERKTGGNINNVVSNSADKQKNQKEKIIEEIVNKIQNFVKEKNVKYQKKNNYYLFMMEDIQEIKQEIERLQIILNNDGKKNWILISYPTVLIKADLLGID